MDYDYNTTQTYTQEAVDPAVAAAAAGMSIMFMVAGLIFLVVIIVALWKIFVKAGYPGWAALIPFYNIYVLLKVVQRPGWWLILYFIPLVSFVISIVVAIDLAKVFGRSGVFGFFLNFLLAPIGQLMLGFGGSKYSPKK